MSIIGVMPIAVIVLFSIVFFVVAVAATVIVAYIFSGRVRGGFDLPERLTRSEVISRIRALRGADDPRQLQADVALSARYCAQAYSLIRAKVESGAKIENYERIFADNYILISSAFSEVRRNIKLFTKLPERNAGGIAAFADIVTGGYGGAADGATVAAMIAAFGSRRPLSWSEICALPTAFTLSYLRRAAVYASKTIYRDRAAKRAVKDAALGRISVESSSDASYVKAYEEAGGNTDKLPRSAAEARESDTEVLSEYGAGMEMLTAGLRKRIFTDEFLISLSTAADVYDTRTRDFSGLTVRTKKAFLALTEKKAKKCGLTDERMAESVAMSAARDNEDIAEYLIPKPFKYSIPVRTITCLFLTAAIGAACALIFRAPFGVICAGLSLPGIFTALSTLYLAIAGRIISPVPVPALAAGCYSARRTAIIVCVAAACREDLISAYKHLKTNAAANSGKSFVYGLLVDCVSPSFSAERAAEDAKSIAAKEERTFILVRKLPRDRKRGAIVDLNDAILTDDYSAFYAVGEPGQCAYVITLDADTFLSDASELVGIMEHPYNRKFGVMSLDMHTAISSLTTPFARLTSGSPGIARYDSSTFGTLYALHGVACYTGKGIYRVRDFSERTGRAFPEGRLLSHDFSEGALAVCGDSGVTALEDCPQNTAAYYERAGRWIRGDIQALPYLRSGAPDFYGRKRAASMPAPVKYIAAENTLRAIFPLFSLAALIVALAAHIALASLFALFPYIAYAAFSLTRLFVDPRNAETGALRQLIAVMYLPHTAFVFTCSVISALISMVTGRGLMRWRAFTPFAGERTLFIANLITGSVCAALFAINLSPAAMAFALFFLLALPTDILLCRRDTARIIPQRDRESAEELARRTWKYFTAALAASDSGLPPDNYSEENGWAMRTSPTDIGMALSAAVCACDAGVASEDERDEFLRKVLSAYSRLEKHRGCPYNWYDAVSMKVLRPAYVSSVDCGNLIAALLHVASIGGDIGKTAENAAKSMDLSFLFRGTMLRIGYNTDSCAADNGVYDLLASESALTYLMAYAEGLTDKSGYLALSRNAFVYKGTALASWTGGVFEYILPQLYLPAPAHSLTAISTRGAIRAHAAYAAKCGSEVLGASESLFAARYDNGDYAYRAFGCPDIALAPSDGSRVFAPYAAVMCAAMTRDCAHIGGLMSGYGSDFGLYDAYDASSRVIVRSSMTHHQGMIMLSLCSLLRPNATSDRMRENSGVRAAMMLLEESPEPLRHAMRKPAPARLTYEEKGRRAVTRGKMPDYAFHTNGSYYMFIDAHGRGASYCRGVCVSRFDYPDGLRVTYACGDDTGDVTEYSECVHYGGYSVFGKRHGNIEFETYAATVAGKCAELRRIKCMNRSRGATVVTLTARDIPCLTSRSADLAHKTFSRMFIGTTYDDQRDYVRAERRGSPVMSALICDLPADYCGDERYAVTGKGVRFGMTTEAALFAKHTLVLAPGEEKCVTFVLGCGDKNELNALCRTVRDQGFGEYCISAARSVPEELVMPAAFSDVAGAIISGGQINGAPPRINIIASESNAQSVALALKCLRRAVSFGAECAVTVLCRAPSSSPQTEKLRAAAKALGNCEIKDISGGMTEEASAALSSGTDIRSLRNVPLPPLPTLPCRPFPQAETDREKAEYPLGIGGFTSNGEYLIDVATPSPWYNVMSDGSVGCIVSDHGEYTFASNSREEKLTYHSCDELNDTPGDGIVLGEGGCLWSTSRTAVQADCEYTARHGAGYSVFKCGYNAVVTERTVYVEGGIKYSKVKLSNMRPAARTIHVMYFAELVLGDSRVRTAGGITCGRYRDGICATNGTLSAYLTATAPAAEQSFCAESYRDGAGKIAACRSLCGGGITPALAYSCKLTLPKNGSAEVTFALSPSPVRVTAESANEAFARVAEKYDSLSPVTSDEKPFKYYLGTLAYQTLVARFTAKCGFQQPGGATGFRDSLQDAMALIGICPKDVRALIVRCASRQFYEGDVLHWWHEPSVGVRTHICDDKLFLPYAVAEYVERTGDDSVLREIAPFLEDKKIPDGQSTLYASFGSSDISASVSEHAMRALRSVRLSKRGLVLMGGGDWNDGMDGVGKLGRGESVWCSMFAYYVAGRWLPYASEEDRRYLAQLRSTLKSAVAFCREGNAYIRAFNDDGMPMGADHGTEGRADLLVAAWAVLSGLEKGEGARAVLSEAYGRLYDGKNKIIKLLDPPFTDPSVGYIANYPAGVRENGGQYTHAAVWFVRALFTADMDELACKLLKELLPSSHTADAEGVEKYLKEPYVIAGDVYSGALAGRGGWTWYTGSAGWMYRTIIELYYGIDCREGRISIRPHMTEGEATVRVRAFGSSFTVKISAKGSGEREIHIGGAEYTSYTFLPDSLSGREVKVMRNARQNGKINVKKVD